MAKSSGLGMSLYLGGNNLSGDVGQIDAIPLDRALLGVTGIDKSAQERLGGLYGSSPLQFTGFFNDAATQEHPVLSALPTADVIVSVLKGSAIGDSAWGLSGKQANYGWTRGNDGALGITTQVHPDDDFVQAGKSLTAGIRTDTTATNGAGVDMTLPAGSSSFGLVAYLQVFSVTGTSVTVTIQESSDNGSGDAFAAVTGGAFAAATPAASPQAQRIQTSLTQTVERYLRAVTSGTFSNAQFNVIAKRYVAANAER